MHESETYTYRVTRAVDLVKAPTFRTPAIDYLAATSIYDLKGSARNHNHSFSFRHLIRMKCLEKIRSGGKKGSGDANEWKIKFEPGPNCESCDFRRIFKNGQTKIRCARIKRKMQDDPTSFPEIRSQVI